jgi:hypothetical protein
MLFFFEAATGQAETGRFDSSGSYQTLKTYLLGTFFVLWSHVVSFGSDDLQFDNLLFYSKTSGQVDIGRLDSSGTFQSLKNYPPGLFHVGWTHIVYSIVPV